MNSDMSFNNDTGEILPAETEAHEIIDVENFPMLTERNGVIVFNKASVDSAARPHAEAVKKAADELAQFLDSDPDLSDRQQYLRLKEAIGSKSQLCQALKAADRVREGKKRIFLDAGSYIQTVFNEIKNTGQPVRKRGQDLINRHDAEEERKAIEDARAERERVQKIESMIDAVKALPSRMIGATREELNASVRSVLSLERDYQEFSDIGKAAEKEAVEKLNILLGQAEVKKQVVAEQKASKITASISAFDETVSWLSDAMQWDGVPKDSADNISVYIVKQLQEGKIPHIRWRSEK